MKLSELSHHHAILVTHPDRKILTDELWTELQTLSPSHRLFDATVLDIETAREVISWSRSSYDGERIGLISFHTAGLPAQNALLKVLEEPNEKTRFILVTSNKENLIDTVLSRVQHHEIHDDTLGTNNDAKLFLITSPVERMKLDFITKILTKTDEKDRKDREVVRAFILSLVHIFASEKNVSKNYSRYTNEIIKISSYASDPSSSGKALLEYLSLVLPQTKS